MLFSELLIVDAVHWHMIRAAQMLVAMVCCITLAPFVVIIVS